MKLRSLALTLVVGALAAVSSAQFATGNLIINQVGDGAAALTNAAAAINFVEFAPNGLNPLGTPVRTLNVASTGANAITQSGSATSEGGISGIHGGNGLYFVGYQSDAGTTGVVASAAPRRVGRLDYATGLVSYTTLDAGTYNANNLRFASGYSTTGSAGSNFVTAGNAANPNGGARSGTFGTGATTLESGTLANTRVAHAFNGGLYASAASGAFLGVSQLNGAGAPTLLFGDGTGSSAYDFQFFAGGAVAYLIDDRASSGANTGGGLQKFVRGANGSYTKVYTIPLGAVGGRQFTATNVDAQGNATFYAVSTDNQLYAFADNTLAGSVTTTATAVSIYTAPANTALRGVEVVPEPASMAAMALGLGTLLARRRRKSA